MGQAKNRGTYEQRVAQAKQREADRLAAAKAVEDEKVRELVHQGHDRTEAVKIVRSGGRRVGFVGKTALLAAMVAGLVADKP